MTYGYSDDLRAKALSYYDTSGKSQAQVTQATDESSILRYRNMAYLMAMHGGTKTQSQTSHQHNLRHGALQGR